jgi:energy-coupling factor transporter ATP-binding protein EcfA2
MHQEVFDFLYKWSKEEQRKGDAVNPFFLLRSAKDPRFKDGYWFPGDEERLYVTFWSGGDSIQKTPNIYFEIIWPGDCRFKINSDDSPIKVDYFIKLWSSINLLSFHEKIDPEKLIKGFLIYENNRDFLKSLESFLMQMKEPIDSYLSQNAPPSFEEFVSPFGFINPLDFDSSITEVLKLRTIKETEVRSREFPNQNEKQIQPLLPLSIHSITIQNYQDIRNVTISDLPEKAHWIFLTGENGYGKTSLLQALALGIYQPRESQWAPPDQTYIELELKDSNAHHLQIHTRRGSVLKLNDLNIPSFCIGYGPARLIAIENAPGVQIEESGLIDTCSGLFNPKTQLLDPERLLFNTSKVEENVFNSLRDLMRKVSNGRIHDIEIREYQVLFREALSNGEILDPVLLKFLAAGLRTTVNLVLDIFERLRKANQHSYPEKFRGIVLIDELENHLHPVLQRELPGTLSKVFPLVQFIASTHSPIPLLGAPHGSVVLKVLRDKEHGIMIERLDEKIDFSNMLPTAILTSPIFGLENIIPEGHAGKNVLETEEDYKEMVATQKKSEDISEYFSDEATERLLKLMKK